MNFTYTIYSTELRDINSWSKKMKDPMINLYGDIFAKYWSDWLDGMITVFNAKGGDICKDLVKHIKAPTFILYGQKDPIVDSCHVSYLQTHIKDSR